MPHPKEPKRAFRMLLMMSKKGELLKAPRIDPKIAQMKFSNMSYSIPAGEPPKTLVIIYPCAGRCASRSCFLPRF
jgi:hypothetical protein